MKVIVFGATGRTGRIIVEKALDAGHEVTAFARRPEAIERTAPGLHVVHGDARDADAVRDAIRGHDVVASALGSRSLKRGTPRADAMRSILAGMEAAGSPRLIAITALGAGESGQQLSPALRVLFSTLLRNVMADHTAEEILIRDAAVDATIVRPVGLTDNPERGSYRVRTGPEIRGGRIPRADVAAFVVHEIAARVYPGATVAIA